MARAIDAHSAERTLSTRREKGGSLADSKGTAPSRAASPSNPSSTTRGGVRHMTPTPSVELLANPSAIPSGEPRLYGHAAHLRPQSWCSLLENWSTVMTALLAEGPDTVRIERRFAGTSM